MRFFGCYNPPPIDPGEGPFPPSIVDDRDAEPIASLVARMVRGQFVPVRNGGYYDSDNGEIDDRNLGVSAFDDVDSDLCDIHASSQAVIEMAEKVNTPEVKDPDPEVKDQDLKDPDVKD